MYKKEEDRTSAQTDGNQWQLRHTPIWSNIDHKVCAKGALASRMHGVHMHKVALKKDDMVSQSPAVRATETRGGINHVSTSYMSVHTTRRVHYIWISGKP